MTRTSYRIWRGDRPCVDCRHHYAYEIEYRCAGCDRGVCAACSVYVRVRSEILCVECARELAEPEG